VYEKLTCRPLTLLRGQPAHFKRRILSAHPWSHHGCHAECALRGYRDRPAVILLGAIASLRRWENFAGELAGRNGSGLCGDATMPRDSLAGSSKR